MIIIQSYKGSEEELMTKIDKLIEDGDAEIVLIEEELTQEQILSNLAFSAKKTKMYLGRIERNTRMIEKALGTIAHALIDITDVDPRDDDSARMQYESKRHRKVADELKEKSFYDRVFEDAQKETGGAVDRTAFDKSLKKLQGGE